MGSLKIACAIALWFAAASCAVGPDYRPPTVAAPTSWLEAWNNGVDTAPADLARWWSQFNDPWLDSLVERAVKSNLDLALAQARIREARAALGVSNADLWPTVDGAIDFNRTRASANNISPGGSFSANQFDLERNLFRTGFDAAWEVDIFGGLRRRVEAAKAMVDVAVEERRAVLVTLLGEVARNYIELRGRQRRLAITQDNLKAQQDILALTKARFGAGLANDLEVAQAEGQAQLTAAQIPALESALKQTVYRLDLLVAGQPGLLWHELAVPVAIPALPPQAQVGLPAELLRRRPDIRRAERQLAAATAQVGAATADLYPKFSLTGVFGLQSISASDWFAGRSRYWSIGPTISWPVFDGGRIRAVIEIRSAQQEQALWLYERSVLNGLAEVESALVSYRMEQNRYRALLEAVSANQRAMLNAEELYRQGLVAYLSVLEAQRSVHAAANDLAQSETNLAVNLVGLYKALGGGWRSD